MCGTFPWRRHCLPQQEQEGRRGSLQLHQQVPGKRLWQGWPDFLKRGPTLKLIFFILGRTFQNC
jgi:hypothetical protein